MIPVYRMDCNSTSSVSSRESNDTSPGLGKCVHSVKRKEQLVSDLDDDQISRPLLTPPSHFNQEPVTTRI